MIDPGRAFGTGAHPTTRLCLQLLQELEPGSLLDVGCGSGVLSIAAALLGFAPVPRVDVEPAAVEATLANAATNGVASMPGSSTSTTSFRRRRRRREHLAGERVRGAARLQAQLLITSGYLLSDRPELAGWAHVERRVLDGWAADVLRRD